MQQVVKILLNPLYVHICESLCSIFVKIKHTELFNKYYLFTIFKKKKS